MSSLQFTFFFPGIKFVFFLFDPRLANCPSSSQVWNKCHLSHCNRVPAGPSESSSSESSGTQCLGLVLLFPCGASCCVFCVCISLGLSHVRTRQPVATSEGRFMPHCFSPALLCSACCDPEQVLFLWVSWTIWARALSCSLLINWWISAACPFVKQPCA